MSKISNLIFNDSTGKNHYITSPYGARNTISTSAGKTSSFHNGTDYGTHNKKLPQYAIEDGYIFAAGKSNSDGALYVWVIYPRIELAFLHYHLDTISVKAGDKVKKGTKIGTTGKTGKATGIHLHLGIRALYELNEKTIQKMSWDALRSMCPYINPEKVVYKEKTAEVKSAVASSTLYFPKYSGKSISIVDALKSLKIDSSYTNRKKIAAKNGIKAYIGTAKQNALLLDLLKKGRLIKP